MDRLPQLGRYFFAIPLAVFGIGYFVYGHSLRVVLRHSQHFTKRT